MRSVVVVLPASTWAMMPILRISESGVVRGIAKVPWVSGPWTGRQKPGILPRHGVDVEKYLGKLLDCVTAAFQAGGLGPEVCRAIAGHPLGRIKAGLADRPAMALEHVLCLLFLALAIFRVDNRLRRP